MNPLFTAVDFANNHTRQQAWDHWLNIGMPERKTEHWKYTPIARMLGQETLKNLSQGRQAKGNFDYANAYQLLFVDGQLMTDLSNLPQGISCLRSSNRREKPEQSVDIDYQKHPFAALAIANAQDGLRIKLDDGVVLDKPLHIVYQYSDPDFATTQHYHHQIILGRNTRCNIIEDNQCQGSQKHFLNVLSTVKLAQDAQCEWTQVNRADQSVHYNHGIHIYQDKNSQFNAIQAAISGALTRCDYHVYLQQPGASCQIHGLHRLDNHHHADTQIVVEHQASHTHSHVFYKSTVDEHAHSVFDSLAIVHSNIEKIVAHQQNKNLLLSQRAQVDTKPELEIHADDVVCSHGATTGQIDTNALLYMQSRGISRDQAKHMLEQAFIQEVLDKLLSKERYQWLTNILKLEAHAL